MKKSSKNYEGILPTYVDLKEILPFFLKKIDKTKKVNIKKIWPEIIGEKLAPMTKAVSFENKILLVKVKNSTLHSLLNNYEKKRLIKKLQEKISKDAIKDIIFKIG